MSDPDNIRTVYIEGDNVVRVHHLVANPHKKFRVHHSPLRKSYAASALVKCRHNRRIG